MMNPAFPDAQPWDILMFTIAAAAIVWLNRRTMFQRGDGVTEVLMPGESNHLSRLKIGPDPINNHRRMKMDKKSAVYIVLGLVIGAVFGVSFGPAIGNATLAIALGAFGGVFVGWFIAAAVLENSKRKNKIAIGNE
jgi:uncharacterized protein YcfJ